MYHSLPQADYWKAEFAKVETALKQAHVEEKATLWGDESELFQVCLYA